MNTPAGWTRPSTSQYAGSNALKLCSLFTARMMMGWPGSIRALGTAVRKRKRNRSNCSAARRAPFSPASLTTTKWGLSTSTHTAGCSAAALEVAASASPRRSEKERSNEAPTEVGAAVAIFASEPINGVMSLPFVENPSAHDSVVHPCGPDLLLRDREDVPGEDHDVGELARHRGVEVGEGVDVLDGGVGPVRHDRAGLHQLLPDVGALRGTPVSQARGDEDRVRRAVDPLHGGDDAELAEARDVGRAQVLRVLDAPADVLLVGVGLEGGLEDVQGLVVGPVADGVYAELVGVGHGELRGLLDRSDGGSC